MGLMYRCTGTVTQRKQTVWWRKRSDWTSRDPFRSCPELSMVMARRLLTRFSRSRLSYTREIRYVVGSIGRSCCGRLIWWLLIYGYLTIINEHFHQLYKLTRNKLTRNISCNKLTCNKQTSLQVDFSPTTKKLADIVNMCAKDLTTCISIVPRLPEVLSKRKGNRETLVSSEWFRLT